MAADSRRNSKSLSMPRAMAEFLPWTSEFLSLFAAFLSENSSWRIASPIGRREMRRPMRASFRGDTLKQAVLNLYCLRRRRRAEREAGRKGVSSDAPSFPPSSPELGRERVLTSIGIFLLLCASTNALSL